MAKLVKVCGLTRPDNIIDVAKSAPDFMGFIFYKLSVRCVTDYSVFKYVPQGIPKVAVFVNEKIDIVADVCKTYGFNTVQLHGNESVDYCTALKITYGLQIIKAFGISPDFNFDQLTMYAPVCDYFLFDTKAVSYGGSGKKFDWYMLDAYKLNKPYFISGGIDTSDALLINMMDNNCIGADINSRFETEPGIKNSVKVENFIKQIRG